MEEHNHGAGCGGCCGAQKTSGISRRDFMAGVGGGLILGPLAVSALAGAFGESAEEYKASAGKKIRVQPVLTVGLFRRAEKTSWRCWGGFHTQKDIEDEKLRIKKELDKLEAEAEFGVEILPLITLNSVNEAKEAAKGEHDVLLMYAANSWVDVLEAVTNPEKWTIVFVRHKSGPVYLWYEVVHNRYLRKTVDEFGQPGVDYTDVVVDNMEEVKWRLRGLYGLKNTLGKKIVCIGGAGGWGDGGQKAPEIARTIWKMELENVDYGLLSELIKKAKGDKRVVEKCTGAAEKYLKKKVISLNTDKKYVVNAFMLAEVFKEIMRGAKTDSITVNNCMGTIMGMAETTACLTLSLLNDDGFTAFCESDFAVIPSGVLLHYISSLPAFLNDPTYPHDGMVTLAHCTAPRKMNGKELEPVKILTHFESDYGAAPKVEMKKGEVITVVCEDFDCKKWLGFEGEIIDNPFLDICRSQIDVAIHGSCEKLNAETRGFHWMACYGNYLKEMGYAVKKMNVGWMNLSA